MEVRDPRGNYRTPYVNSGESMTDTTHFYACDINYIVNRYARSGQLPPQTVQPVYADVTELQHEGLLQLMQYGQELAERAALQLNELNADALLKADSSARREAEIAGQQVENGQAVPK